MNPKLNIQDKKGKTPLHLAAEYGHGSHVQAILKKDTKKELFLQKENEEKTALYLAIEKKIS